MLCISFGEKCQGLHFGRLFHPDDKSQPGTDVMIFKIFLPKNLAKNWRF
jgi:hypothetical protein